MKKFIIPDNVVYHEVSGEIVLLNLNNETYYGLNEIGARIWLLLKEHYTLEAICNSICEEYNVHEDHAKKDIHTLLTELVDADLLIADQNNF